MVYVASDHLGSPRVVIDATGAVIRTTKYDSYGQVLLDSNATLDLPVGFAGGIPDNTGLTRFGFRDYEPATGRWVSRDPILYQSGQANLYQYVENNPINYTDPTGLFWFRQSWQTDFVVGRARSLVEPGGAISRFIEDYVPAGRTFGDLHDGFVDFTAPDGSESWRDWLTNIPSMIPVYGIALGTEVLRTLGILSQPTPKEKSTPCK